MDRPTISIKLLKEENQAIQYAYEGRMTSDFSNAGIIEFQMETVKKLRKTPIKKDYTMLSIYSFLTDELKVIKVCEYPLVSESGEDYCSIYAFACIIESFFKTDQLPKKIYCLEENDVQHFEQISNTEELLKHEQTKDN